MISGLDGADQQYDGNRHQPADVGNGGGHGFVCILL